MSTIFIKTVKKEGKKRRLILYLEKRYTGIATLVIGKEEVAPICASRRSRVQRFRGSRFHSRPWTPFRMHIYEKSVIFVRPNPKFGAKLAITWENEHF